jgi:hypothetical protein
VASRRLGFAFPRLDLGLALITDRGGKVHIYDTFSVFWIFYLEEPADAEADYQSWRLKSEY